MSVPVSGTPRLVRHQCDEDDRHVEEVADAETGRLDQDERGKDAGIRRRCKGEDRPPGVHRGRRHTLTKGRRNPSCAASLVRGVGSGVDGPLRENGRVARLLVLGAGPAQLGVLAAARRAGLAVVAADRDPSAPGFREADRRAIVSIEDEPAIERLARAEQVDGIVAPGTDHAVATAARIASRLGVPHPLTPEAAQLAVSRQAPAGASRRGRDPAAQVARLPDARRGHRGR